MDTSIMSWSFADPGGWTIACALFVLLSGAIGGGVYALSYRLYVTSLSGFSRLELRDGRLSIHYILPNRTVVLPFSEILSVQEESAYKGRWRLAIIAETGETYESALAFRDDVHRAGTFLKKQIAQPDALSR